VLSSRFTTYRRLARLIGIFFSSARRGASSRSWKDRLMDVVEATSQIDNEEEIDPAGCRATHDAEKPLAR